MNKINNLEQLEIITSWINGIAIQYQDSLGDWIDHNKYNPEFDLSQISFRVTYRLKPVLQEIWCICADKHVVECFNSSNEADIAHVFISNNETLKVKHFMEL